MANPPGTRANRWNQMVSAVARELSWTTAQSDAWLNTVWVGMFVDETAGDLVAHDRLRKWLEVNDTTSCTLPAAMRAWLL